MSLWVNMVVFLVVISSVYYIIGYNSGFVYNLASTIGVDPNNGAINGNGSFWLQVIGLFGGVGLIIGTIFFPNPYTLFSGIALFLLALVPSFYDIVASSGLPQPIMIGWGVIFGAIGLITVIAFIKGGD